MKVLFEYLDNGQKRFICANDDTTPTPVFTPVFTPVLVPTTPTTGLKLNRLEVPKTADAPNGQKIVKITVTGGSGNYRYVLGDKDYAGTIIHMPPSITWNVEVFDVHNSSSRVGLEIKSLPVGEGSITDFNETVVPSVVPTPIETPTVVLPTPTITVPMGTNGNTPLIGAVRWDWWADNFECTVKWLSPNKYHRKAPFFAKEINPDKLELKGNTQEIVDKEIEYATYAGIDYFAFDWYEGFDDGTRYNGSYGRELFKKSTKKGNMKMCYILEATSLPNNGEFSTNSFKDICTDFGRDDYQKINGRPLFFYMTYPPLTPNQVAIINNTYSSIYPNKPLPYIVNAIQVGEQEAQMNNNTGIAAWSQYTGYGKVGDLNMRERYKSAGVKLIPTLTVGWHTTPIADNPCSWYQGAPAEEEQRLVGEELKNHLIDTINFVKSNPTTCEANTILCYAWNENAEGGYIVPTIIPNTSDINTEIIDVFRQVLKPNEPIQ
jgi:hypothetical protein